MKRFTRRTAMAAATAMTLTTSAALAQDAAALEQNKAIAISLSTAIMNGDWAQVDGLLSDDYQYVTDGQPAIGKQEYIGFMQHVLSSAMTDMDMNFVHVLAEGDLVAVDYTNAMTNSGPFFGMPATGKRVIATGQFIREIRDGQVVNEWQTTNTAGLMAQLTGG